MKLVELWLIELAKGVGRFFLSPLTYWAIALVYIVGYFRVRQERSQFRTKIKAPLAEWQSSWKVSLLAGLIISLITLGSGMVLTYDVIILLAIVTFILSLTFNYALLSPSYTLGLTFLIAIFWPYILEVQDFIDMTLFTSVNNTSLAVLLGLLLFVEAFSLRHIKRHETFAERIPSDRGSWLGRHRLKQLNIIPLFILVPSGLITPIAPYWPYFDIGSQSYSIVLLPFLLGFNHLVRSQLPQTAAKRLAKPIFWLAFLVVIVALGSLYESFVWSEWLPLVAVILAIFGRLIIKWHYRRQDKVRQAYFKPVNDGLIVLAVIPDSPAERLGILVGEKIVKVNGEHLTDPWHFYDLLLETSVNYRLEVIDDAGEIRYVQGALYEDDHYELGIIFAEKPTPSA